MATYKGLKKDVHSIYNHWILSSLDKLAPCKDDQLSLSTQCSIKQVERHRFRTITQRGHFDMCLLVIIV